MYRVLRTKSSVSLMLSSWVISTVLPRQLTGTRVTMLSFTLASTMREAKTLFPEHKVHYVCTLSVRGVAGYLTFRFYSLTSGRRL